MLNENQNNTNNWRSKLDELESLQGETIFDKNVSWEKLYDKLKGKKSIKKAVWYWIAAASVLIVLMISFLNSNNEHHQIIKKETVQKQAENQNTFSPINKQPSIKSIDPGLFEKNKTIVFDNNKSKIIHSPIATKAKNYIHVPNTVSSNDTIAQSSNIVSQPENNILAKASTFPAKKKLKVVHINELGDPVEESPDVARNADIHSFQFKFGNGGAYNSSLTSKTTGNTFLKTKTSPN